MVDRLLFDAKPPEGAKLPGGNAVAFDWTLLEEKTWTKPWMLAGGLTPANVATAVRLTGAPCVDTSSGVEDEPGKKNPQLIRDFIGGAARALMFPVGQPSPRVLMPGMTRADWPTLGRFCPWIPAQGRDDDYCNC